MNSIVGSFFICRRGRSPNNETATATTNSIKNREIERRRNREREIEGVGGDRVVRRVQIEQVDSCHTIVLESRQPTDIVIELVVAVFIFSTFGVKANS